MYMLFPDILWYIRIYANLFHVLDEGRVRNSFIWSHLALTLLSLTMTALFSVRVSTVSLLRFLGRLCSIEFKL